MMSVIYKLEHKLTCHICMHYKTDVLIEKWILLMNFFDPGLMLKAELVNLYMPI